MRPTRFIVAVLMVTAATSVGGAQATPRQAGDPAAKQLRVALLPFENHAGSAGDRISAQLADEAATKSAAVPRAQLVRVDRESDVNARDPLATIASRTTSSLVVRGTIAQTGEDIVLNADVVDPRSGGVVHRLVAERAPAAAPTVAVQRMASRIAGMMALHTSPAFFRPDLYTPTLLEAFVLYTRADSLFASGRPGQARPLFLEAYRLDSNYVWSLFTPVAIAGGAGQRDSLLQVITTHQEHLTQVERFLIGWYSGEPLVSYAAARSGAALDPQGWAYAVGLRANQAGYFKEAAEALSMRRQLAAAGNINAARWPAWRTQYAGALHALGDHARELEEVKSARAELPGATERTMLAQELRALAALGRVEELHAVVDRELAIRADSVNIAALSEAGLELRVHGHLAEGDRLFATLADFALAHEAQVDSLEVASVLGLARRYDEALPRLARLTEHSSDNTRLGRYGVVAILAGKPDIGDQMAQRFVAMGDVVGAHHWLGSLAAAKGDCAAAMAHFRAGVRRGLAYAANSWWHDDPSLEPIWSCPELKQLAPMHAP